MSRTKSDAPGYHASDQAVVTLDGRKFYLGPHDSPESKARYFALLNEYHANGLRMPEDRQSQPAEMTIQVVCAEYRENIAEQYANAPTEILTRGGVRSHVVQVQNKTPDSHGPAGELSAE
jgi:hypothetical protein